MRRQYTLAGRMVAGRTFASRIILHLFVCGVLVAALPAFATDIHIAQVSRGTDSGDSPDNAHSVAWVNNGANWGSATSQVSPGDTVYFHGEITSRIDIPGSGASGTGNRVTLDFADASMNASDSVQIDFNAHDYLTVTNVTFADSVTSGNLFLLGDTASYITVSNCTYVGPDDGSVYAVNHQYGTNTLIEDNHFENVAYGVGGDSIRNHDITIRGNTILGSPIGTEQDIIKFGDVYNLTIEGNYLVVRKANSAADPVNDFHADVLQSYRKGGGSAGNPTNWTIRYNTVELDTDNEYHRSWTMFENMTGDVYIYSNVFLGTHGGQSGNGLTISISESALNAHIYNNTFVIKDGPGNAIACRYEGTFYFRNNIAYSVESGSTVVKAPAAPGFVRSNNIYCGGALYDGGSCASWVAGETDSYADTDPLFVDLNNNDFRLLLGSPGIDGGTTVPVPQDYAGIPRPQGSAHDIGAFEFVSGESPTTTMASASDDPTNASPIPVTVTFSESVTGFQGTDIVTSNATISYFAGSGASYNFGLEPTSDGLVTADIPADVALSIGGAGNIAADQFSRTYDSAAPSVSMSSAAPDPTNTSPISVTVTFSESVNGFDDSDVSASNATVANFSGSGADYSFDLVPTAQGLVTVDIGVDAAQDAAGNGNTAAAQFSRVFDSSNPTVVMSSPTTPSTNVSPIPVTVTFNQTVVGFQASDIATTNGSATGFTPVSGAVYTFNLVPASQGATSANIAAGVAQDGAGNPNTAAPQFSRTYDTTSPTVNMSSTAGDPANDSPIPVTVAFSEPVTGFNSGDLSLSNGTAADFSGTGANYSFNLIPSSDGSVTVDINAGRAQDAAGNANVAAPQFSRTYDSTKPTVSMSSAAANPTNQSPIPVAVVFSESVTGFEASDVAAGNAAVANFAGSGANYSFNLVPSSEGAVTADIAAGVAQDAMGSVNTAASQFSRTYDGTIPTVSMNTTAPDPTNVSAIPVTITFSESVTGFSAARITTTNAGVSAFVGSGANYSFNLIPAGDGFVAADIEADVAFDAAGNGNSAASQLGRNYDSTRPSVVIDSTAPSTTNTQPIAVTVTFSESVSGFTPSDIVVSNATKSNFSGSGANYSLDLTPVSDGAVTVNIAAGVASDSASNGNTAATAFSRMYDTTSATVNMSSAAPNPTNLSPIPVTVTFNEDVTGFDSSDITPGNASVVDFSGSGANYTFGLLPSGDGDVTADIGADVAQDAAGNNNVAATQFSRTYDGTLPTVAMASTAPNPTNASPIPVTVTFSEPVTGFVSSDVVAGNATVNNFSGSGTSYSFDLVPTGDGDVTADIGADAALDAAGNGNTAATQVSRTYDVTTPTVAMTSSAGNPTNTTPIPVTVTFSEPVGGFTVSDIVASNATKANFAGSGADYSFDLIPSGQGPVTADIAADAAQDAAGNSSEAASQFTRTYDSVPPGTSIGCAYPDPTNQSPLPMTVTFTKVVTGFDVSDLTLGNATAEGFAGAGSSYSFDLVLSSDGLVTVDIAAGVAQDAAGNDNSAATQFSRTYDSTQPTVAMSSGTSNPTNVSPIPITVTFSEVVQGFSLSDIAASNATAADLAGSGSSYTFDLVPAGQGTVTADIAVSAVQDAAGNDNTAAAQFSRVFDSENPTVLMSSATGTQTNVSPIPVTVTFSKDVTGFDASDIAATNGAVSGFSAISGSVYTFELTPAGEVLVTADIAAGVAQDLASNPNMAAPQFSRTYDATAPTVVLDSTAGNPTTVSPIPVTVTFSEPVTGFEVSNVATSNASAANFAGSGDSYSFNLIPAGDGLTTADVPSAAAQDAAGNASTAAIQLSRTFDGTSPSVSLSSGAPDPTNTTPIPVTVTFSESVTGFASSDITTSNASVANFAGSGASYTFDLVPAGDGLVTASAAAGVAQDSAGNPNTASSQLSRTYDGTTPAVGMSSAVPNPTNAAPIPVTVTFSESVTGFDASDVAATNASVASFAGSGASYSFDLTPSGQGSVAADIAAGVAQDAAGNDNSAATQFSRTFDSIAPTVVIDSTTGDPTNVSPIPVTVTFSEAVTGFSASDLAVGNGAITGFSGSAANYSFDVVPAGQGTVTADIAVSAVQDAAGNDNTAAAQFSRVFDSENPTVLMSSATGTPTNVSPIPVTVTFSKDVTGFDASDIVATNGSVSGFSAISGSAYTFELTPAGEVLVTADIAAGAAQDSASNPNTAAPQFSRTYDATAPTVVLNSTAGNPTTVSPIPVTVTFSEAVTGFEVSDVATSNSSVANFAGSGASYSFNLVPAGDGMVTADIGSEAAHDAAGNPSTAATQLSRTFDGTAPSVALSSAAPDPTNTTPIPVTATFSESVTGFDSSDITTSNATVANFAGSGASYSFELVPAGNGVVTAGVAAGVAQDSAGNANTASPQLSRTYDGTTPTVGMSSAAPNPTNASPIPVTVTFSESVTGFDASDVAATNASVAGFAGSGASYSFDLTPSGQGGVAADIGADSAQDAAGNGNTGSAQFSRTFDSVAPTLIIDSTTGDPTNVSPIPVTVTFSEAVTGFNASDLAIGNGAVTGFSGSGANYSFDVVPAGQGTVTVDVASGAAQDAAGNGNTAAAQFSRIFDNTNPTVSTSSTAGEPTNTSPIPVSVTFNQDVTGFDSSDIVAGNGTVANFAATSGSQYTFDLVPTAQGSVTADIAAGVAQDGSGNPNEAAPQFARTFDTVAPSVSMTSAAPDPTNASALSVTVSFSEAVAGFNAYDVATSNATVSDFAGSGASYSFNLIPAGQGPVTANIAAGAAQDAAGNVSTAAPQFSRVFDALAPTVAMSSAVGDPANSSPIPVTVAFSEAVIGFAAADVTPSNATINGFSGSGANYSFNLVPSGQGTVTADIPGGAAQDAAGNASTAAPQFSRVFDTVVPSVAMSSGLPNPTSTSPIPVTVTFSEAVFGFTAADVVTSNGTATNLSGSGAIYSFDLVPSGQGTVTADIPGGAAQDAADNDNTAAPQFSRDFDATAPTVLMSTVAPDPTPNSPIPVTVTFSKPVTGFDSSDVSTAGATVTNFGGSDAAYAFELVPAGDGLITADIAPGVAQDGAGNGNTAAPQFSIVFDSADPTVVMSSPAGSATNVSPIPVTVTFSEPVTGFDQADVVITNSALANFSGSGANYSFDLIPSGEVEAGADIAASVAQDLAGNENSAAPAFRCTYDVTAPAVNISTTAPNPTQTAPIRFYATFSENVLGFTPSDVSPTNASVGTFLGSGANYEFCLNPSSEGTVTAEILAGVVQDAAGNVNTAATPVSRVYDSVAPSVSSVVRGGASPTNAASVSFIVTFSENVTGVDAADFAVAATGLSGASLSGVTGSGSSYTVIVDTGSGIGSLGIEVIDNGSILDAAGNDLSGPYVSGQQYIVDKIPPQVNAIGRGGPNPTNAPSVVFTVAFSESVTGVDPSDFVLDASGVTGTSIAGVSGSGPSYTVTVNAGAGEGTLSIDFVDNDSVVDGVGNPTGGAGPGNGSYTAGETYTVDRTQPTVVLSTSASEPTDVSPIPVTATFSEPVTGFYASDVTTSNATVTGFAGSGTTYSFGLVPASQGPVTVEIEADVVQDSAGNGNTASAQLSRTYDTIPAVTMVSALPDPTNVSPIGVTVTFTEPVAGFDASDIAITNATLDGFVGAGANYSFGLVPESDGLVTADIPAGAAQDSTGNDNLAAPQFSRTFSSVAPSVTVEQGPDQPDPTIALPIEFVVTFSEEVTGFDASDVGMNGTAPGLVFEVLGSGADYTISVTGVSGDGTIIPELPGGAAMDLAGNPSEPSTSVDNSVTYLMPRTIYVDAANSGPEDGSWDHPFNTIAEGLTTAQANRGDKVIVRPGVYPEDVAVEEGETLQSEEGAYHTLITGASPSKHAVTLANGSVLRGFTVCNKPYTAAVYVSNWAGVEVTNCVLHGSEIGLYAGPNAAVAFVNNVAYDNSAAGVYAQVGASMAVLKNNVFAHNSRGISGDPGTVQSGGFNNFFDNEWDYVGVSASPGDFVADPLFVDPDLLNFHLRLASPCRDGGDPAPEHNDKDGSRNDVGADGGPYGAQDVLAPQIVMNVSPTQGLAPLDVTLDASGTTDEWGIALCSWDLDISNGIQEDVVGATSTVTYFGVSTYTITLTVTDNSGLTAQATRDVEIGNGLPTVSGTASPHAGPVPLNVQFSGDGEDPDGGPLTWSWDFDGDGTTDSALQNPAHDYPLGSPPGAYRSVLTVTDDEGAAASDLVPVTITEEAVLASALAVPGTAGTVEVTAACPLLGMTIQYPGSACPEKTVLAINGVTSFPSVPLQYVEVMAQVGPAGMVFSQPLTIAMPLPPGTNTSQDLEALLYDAASGTWKRTGITNLGVLNGTPAMFRFTATQGATYAVAGEILPVAQFTESQVSIGEGDGNVTLTIQLSEVVRPGNPATVGVTTSNRTARAGEDYNFVSSLVVFTGDETQKTVTVPLIDDTAEESREEFRLVITIVEGGTTGAISNVTITVIDDDAPDTTEPPTTDKPPAVEPPSYERPATPSVPSGCASLEPPSGKIGPPPTEMLAALSLLALAALRKRLVPRERVPVRIRH